MRLGAPRGRRATSRGVRRHTVDEPDRRCEIAVDGLVSDHERAAARAHGPRRRRCGARLQKGRSASARAVAAAASTGPIPQTRPSRPSSSRSVAATRRTSGTARSYGLASGPWAAHSEVTPTRPTAGSQSRACWIRCHGNGNREYHGRRGRPRSRPETLCSQRASAGPATSCGLTLRSATRIAIADAARTDGTNVVAARPERELPGAPLLRLEQAGRDHLLRRI